MLPNLIIIGAAKCGTTSLHNYLNLHPQISMSQDKEPEFFIEEKNWSKGLDWYKSIFPSNAKIIGESSTSYSKYPVFKGIAERMHSIIPHAKLIYVVRDPIERIVSHYLERVCRGWESRDLDEILIELEENPYVDYSKYYMQIEQYLKHYSRSSILMIDFDELKLNRKETLKKIFQFLGVDSSFNHKDFLIRHNISKGKRKPNRLSKFIEPVPVLSELRERMPWLFSSQINKPVLTESIRQDLADLMYEDVEKLRNFTGHDFAKWQF